MIPDNRVITITSELLASVSILEILPTIQQKVEFADRAMKTILGFTDSGFCLREYLPSFPVDAACLGCRVKDAARMDRLFDCPLQNNPNYRMIPLSTTESFFGYFLVSEEFIKQIFVFEHLLLNFLTILSISLDNLQKSHDLEKLNLSLQQSEARYMVLSGQFEAILDHIPGMVFHKDKKNNFIHVNKYLAQSQGKEKEELEGKNLSDIYTKAYSEDYYQDDLSVINSGVAKLNIVEPWETSKGIKWVSTSKIPFIDGNGEIIGVIGISMDITEHKQAEEEIKSKNKELQNLNATKDRFFSIIAHDLKSPFNSIVGFSKLLVEKVKENNYNGIERYAGIILQSSEHALELIMNLMEWSRSQTGRIEFNPEYFEIVDFITGITPLFADIAGQKSIIIKKDLPPNSPVFADKAMVSTILRNLISNAIKFTRPGGEIVIKAKEQPNELIVSVSDNGVGISAVTMGKLFRIDENYTTPGTNNEKGTGLGLILCKEFAEKLGGKIWVESLEGKGSTFYFTLPDNTES